MRDQRIATKEMTAQTNLGYYFKPRGQCAKLVVQKKRVSRKKKNTKTGVGGFYIVTNIVWMPWILNQSELFDHIKIYSNPQIAGCGKKKMKDTLLHTVPDGAVLYKMLPPNKSECGYVRPVSVFHNMTTLEINVRGSLCSIKVPSTGNIQITGCLDSEHALDVMRIFRDILAQPSVVRSGCVDYVGRPDYKFMCRSVMNNSKDTLGFCVDGDALAMMLNSDSAFNGVAVYRPNTRYSAVNIKVRRNGVPSDATVLETGGEKVPWDAYLKRLPEAARRKTEEKTSSSETTFLVFRTGIFIQISPWKELAESTKTAFVEYMNKRRHLFEDAATG